MAPAIEIAIALAAAFWIVSLASSAAVEWFSQNVFRKRANDLNKVVGRLLDDADRAGTGDTLGTFKATSVYRALQIASSRKRGNETVDRLPSYLSARAFADGVVEMLTTMAQTGDQTSDQLDALVGRLPDGPLRKRLNGLLAEVGDDLLEVKAGLEGWFDDTMDRLEGAYKRWSQWVLLTTGTVVAVLMNVSAVTIADGLWNDEALRTATAAQVIDNLPCPADGNEAGDEGCTPDERLEELGLTLPIGWGEASRPEATLWGMIAAATGWLVTGLATMLGAPFWFDILGRLVNLRQTRGVPPKADADQGSALSMLRAGAGGRRSLSDALGLPQPGG